MSLLMVLGFELLFERLAAHLEREAAAPVPDIEHHAPLDRRPDLRHHHSIGIEHAVGLRVETVRHDVAGPEQRQKIGQWIHRAADMDHDRHPRRVRHLARHLQRGQGVLARHTFLEPHLDPHHHVPMPLQHLERLNRVGPAEILQLADDVADHAGGGDVHQREDARAHPIDDVFAKARERLRA